MPEILINDKLIELGFKKTHHVEGRSSIAALIGKRKCGIYVLHFANDDYYVGQSVNVVQRFAQHTRRHTDIQRITFKSINRRGLDIEEVRVTKALETLGVFLRNIKIVTFTHAVETDFDAIMSPTEQQEWENNLGLIDLGGIRNHDDYLRKRYSANFKKYLNLPFAYDITSVLRSYALNTIPAIKRGEIDFWMCSCLPSNSNILYSRINIGWQTTLQVSLNDGQPQFCWFLPKSSIPKTLETRWKINNYIRIILNGSNTVSGSSSLIAGGLDQVFVEARGLNAANQILSDERMIKAFRHFNLGLVRKSPCPWGRNHCLDLADRLVE